MNITTEEPIDPDIERRLVSALGQLAESHTPMAGAGVPPKRSASRRPR